MGSKWHISEIPRFATFSYPITQVTQLRTISIMSASNARTESEGTLEEVKTKRFRHT